MERIPGKDAVFLLADTPQTPMQIAFAGVFDPSTTPGGPPASGELFRRFESLLRDRIHLVPKFRQRIVEVPFGLDHPYLVGDPHFDLDYHLRRTALPAPGGRRELQEFIGRIVSRPLDPTRPLWEIYVVEGVEGGRWAYVGKAHHVLVDGVGGNEMLVNLLDLTPESRHVEPPDEAFAPEPVPGDLRLLTSAVSGTLRKPLRFLDTLRRSADVAVDLASWAVRRGDEEPGLRVLGPRTLLNGPVGPHRQVAFGRFSLDTIKAAKAGLGCTVNDVVLAVVGRGLRRFLAAQDESPERSLVASVPISIRPKDDTISDNQVSGMTVPFHDDVEDVVEQVRRISQATRPAKDKLGAVAASILTDWSEYAVPAVATQAFRFYTRMGLARRHPPIANVTLSNVPGPSFPLYLAGSKMTSMYPMGPVIPNQRMNITVVSYLDEMFVGVIADRDHVPDCDELVTAIVEEVETVAAAADSAAG